MEQKTKILIADDDRAFAVALKDHLAGLDRYEICGMADNVRVDAGCILRWGELVVDQGLAIDDIAI